MSGPATRTPPADANPPNAAAALAAALAAGGARHAVVCPGSRNTPVVLVLERLAAEGRLHLHPVLDERTAGFLALGLARAGAGPVIVSTTSGSAGAHLLPAIAEADASALPLVVLTADRPEHLHGVGAPQTTRQGGFGGGLVRLAVRVEGGPAPGSGWLATLAARVLEAAAGPHPGPVHVDLAFRKPLWRPDAPLPDPGRAPPPVHRPPPAPSAPWLEALRARLAGRRGLLVAGPADGPAPWRDAALRAAALRFSVHAGWPVVADAASPLRWTGRAIAHADAFLRDPALARRLAPEVVLRVGRTPTSRAVADAIAGAPAILVDAHGRWHDPEHAAERLVAADPAWLLEALANLPPTPPAWRTRWETADRAAAEALAPHLGRGRWQGRLAASLVGALPPGALLHLASSWPIRAVDGFGGNRPDLHVAASRGVNGIDGTIATALGEALLHPGPTAVFLGDLAFLHDVGSLQLAAGLDRPLALVVVDNGGGGIFDHLPTAAHPTAHEPLLVQPHRQELPALAAAFGLPVERLDDLAHLPAALAHALARPHPTLLWCPVDRREDLEAHRAAWVAAAVAARTAVGGAG